MSIKNLVSRATINNTLNTRQKRIYAFLKEQHVGVLSSVTPDGNPHGVVVYYAVEDNFIISFLTKKGTHKYDNLLHNNHVMFTVFQPLTQTTVQVTGIAVERENQSSVNKITGAIFGDSLSTSDVGLPPIVKLQAGAFTMFQIRPVQIRMATYSRPESGDYDQLFDSIESFEFKEVS